MFYRMTSALIAAMGYYNQLEREVEEDMTQPVFSRVNWDHGNAPTVTNEQGGSQSALNHDWSLIDWDVMAMVESVLREGAAKRGRENWKCVPATDHVKHAVEHTIAALRSSYVEERCEHLINAICRCMFAVSIYYDLHKKGVAIRKQSEKNHDAS